MSFERARLETVKGEKVTDVEVPPFDPPPEILIWGQRFFKHHEGATYREAFAYWIAPDQTKA